MNESAYREAETRFLESVRIHPQESFVRLPRLGASVRVQTVGSGPPVLFIHGGPNAGTTWAPLVSRMTGVTCHLLDRPGTGLSDRYVVDKADLVGFASHLVVDVLDGLGIERAHVVASSFGGYCALHSAAASPERFLRMVQMACPALLPGQQMPPFMKLITTPGLRHFIGALPPNRRVQDSILRQIGHGKTLDAGQMPQEHGDWYMALTRHTETMKNDGEMIFRLRRGRRFDERVALDEATLARVTTPTHFLWGADDTFGDEEVARWVVGVMPNATVEMIPDSGHLPWLDDPGYIADQTMAFLDRVDQAPIDEGALS